MATPVIVTCEHASARVPVGLQGALGIPASWLRDHRGFDLGAADLARRLARRLRAPVVLGTVSRLVVDLNRSLGNPGLWSVKARELPESKRSALVRRYHAPYVGRVRGHLDAALAAAPAVAHLSVHSFTPRLRGVTRPMDVGLLYDPRRGWEVELVEVLRRELRERGLAVRRNAPYRGTSDGLTRSLRTMYEADRYAGLELEVNQRWVEGGRVVATVRRAVVDAVVAAMGRS